MAGKVCVVTGANSGIGKWTAEQLAEDGATVLMVCRRRERGEAALAEVRKRSGSTSIELLVADFASFDSVRGLARGLAESHDKLGVLVNNVGVARVRRSVTVDGYETTFQVNYLSHFLLTNLLLDELKRGAPSRVVNVSSASHFGARMNMDDLQLRRRWGDEGVWAVEVGPGSLYL